MTISTNYTKCLVFVAILLSVTSASAQVPDLGLMSFDTPSASEWAVARARDACKMNISVRTGYSGNITAGGDGLIFTVYNTAGQTVAAATAKGSSLLCRARCL
jgi:hypothetical protein